jgi:predicted homoserine dehydrogenase-like protein
MFRPYHLLGIETPRTIFRAVRENRSHLDADYRPNYDLVALAAANLAAGRRLASKANGQQLLAAQIRPAQPLRTGRPVPYHLAPGRRLKTDLAAGEILTVDMLETPADSILWRLRQQQDDLFW